MKIKNSYKIIVSSALLMFILGCDISDSKQNSSSVREITDMLGRKVNVPLNVDKVVGVGPGALRLLVYMDLVDKISGVEDVEMRPGRPYTFARPELTAKPVIGPYMGGDSELIVMNNPDVIFMAFSSASDADDLQKMTGLPVVGLNSGNLRNARDMLYEAFHLIGEIAGNTERADSLKRFINRQIRDLDSITSASDTSASPKAYIGAVSYRGAHGISSTEAHYTPFSFANAINVAGIIKSDESIQPTGTYVDVEKIIQWDSDYLFVDAAGLELVKPDISKGAPLSETLSAVRDGHVYTMMPHNWYATNFENVLINSWYAAKIMYPGLFSDADFQKKAREIYFYMLGKDVYDEMKNFYNGWEKL